MTGLLARGASVSRLAMEVDTTESEGEGSGVWLSAAVGDVLIATLSREIVDPKDRVKLACELTGPAVTKISMPVVGISVDSDPVSSSDEGGSLLDETLKSDDRAD